MERKKMVWIILSVTLLFVVVLAGGLYLLRPQQPPDEAVVSGAGAPAPRDFDVFEYIRGDSTVPGLEPPEEPGEMVIIVGEKPREDRAAPPAERPPAERPPAEPPPEKAPPVQPPPAAPPPAAPKKPADRPAAPPARTTPARPAPREVTVAEYWIQVASMQSAVRAQELAEDLAGRGLAPRLTTRVVDGTTWHRVRIGPYTRKEEAEKFLEWIRQVKGLEASYISKVYARRIDP